ncbi:enoyl-CoA hydratase/isomerase family, partial [Thraustotheca clavata]
FHMPSMAQDDPFPRNHHRLDPISLLWLWGSFSCTIWYLYILRPSFSNDLWWPNYNASGHQAFLIDSINFLLKTEISMGQVDITTVLSDKSYGTDLTYPFVYPGDGAAILTTQLISLPHAIETIRNMSSVYLLWVPTQFCWVDFTKQWEIATTDKRQSRCAHKYSTNSAVYLEAFLRNTKWSKFIANFGGPGNLFTVGIQLALEETKAGLLWLNSTASCNTSFKEELLYWTSFNLSTFKLQWQNAILTGLDDNVQIVNALGIGQSVTIKANAQLGGPWTSGVFNAFFNNDLNLLVNGCNSSLVRGSSNYFMIVPCDYMQPPVFESLAALFDESGDYINQTGLIHSTFGSYLSVDMWILPVPTDLVNLVSTFNKRLSESLLESNQLRDLYNNVEKITLSPLPPMWNGDYFYFGGNPMCLGGSAQIFSQQSFSATDSCSTPVPFSLMLSKRSILFGLSITNDSTTSICKLQTSPNCQTVLSHASELRPSIEINSFEVENVSKTIDFINISLMQFATDYSQTNWSLLVQPLLQEEWAFYAWTILYDWTIGIREVVAFEGDDGTLVLISDAFNINSNDPSIEIITNSTYIIYYIVIYFSGILGLLTLATSIFAFTCRLKLDTRNLFFFYRVGGSTWLGRPLMFLRGCTAILLLSTAPIALSNVQNLTKFDSTPRSWVETFVLVNEANWVTYVVTEFVILLNPKSVRLSGMISCVIVWLIYIIVDLYQPIKIITHLDRTCTNQELYFQLHCSGSVISIGDYTRVCTLISVPVLFVPIITIFVALLNLDDTKCDFNTYPGVAQAFLVGKNRDKHSDLLAGLVPWTKDRILNFNLWLLLTPSKNLPHVSQIVSGQMIITKWHAWNQRLWIVVGSIYIVAAIYSSISYFYIAQVNWSNDLIWAGFNMTGAHLFLANWYLSCIALGASDTSYQLDGPSINSFDSYNLSSTIIMPSHHFGSRVHRTNLTGLLDAIEGLRESNACMAPWIFTQYCFVDFQQRWEMANSLKRQLRCNSMTENGAVFLESLLRNILWTDWMACWGDEFEVAIANELKRTSKGQSFLDDVSLSRQSIPDEANYWNQFGVKKYDLQWQNYKYIGVANSYSIINAYGGQYPFTIQSTLGAYRWNQQTSLKMYWGLGNDFLAIMDNTTSIGGKSLVRSSSNFAFSNISIQQIYVEYGTILSSPITVGVLISMKSLGPFGSVDVKYISVPDNLSHGARSITEAFYTLRGQSIHLQQAYANIKWASLIISAPQQWLDIGMYTISGSLLCPPSTTSGSSTIRSGLLQFFTFSRQCTTSVTTYFSPHPEHIIYASVLASITHESNLSTICAQAIGSKSMCKKAILSVLTLTDALDIIALREQWIKVAYDAAIALNIQILQFGVANLTSPATIFRLPIIDQTNPVYDFFAWMYIFDWIKGNREVVSFQGDEDSWTIMGDGGINSIQPIVTTELPVVFSIYAHRAIEYVTIVMTLLAILTAIYIILSRGYIAGGNMLELSRVGGIIWVGRPFLFVRGITAMSLLATATLKLDLSNSLTSFSAGVLPWYTTCLAANEVTWLGGIVTDIGLIISTDYAYYYSTWNSVLIWIITSCLTILLPVQHEAKYSPECQIVTIDFQIKCHSGTVAIGSLQRFGELIFIVIASNIFCYFVWKFLWPNVSPRRGQSILLSAGAKYLLDNDDWVINGVYYMDRATAVLDGLLIEVKGLRQRQSGGLNRLPSSNMLFTTRIAKTINRGRLFSSSIQELFKEKIALGKTLPPLDDNQTKLQMYALFKQATEGKCNSPKPGMLDFVGKAKWDAWTGLSHMSTNEAMEKYCSFIDGLAAKAGVGQSKAAENPAEDILIKLDSGILTVEFNRPKKFNALNIGMYEAVISALTNKDPNIKVIVIKAKGPMFSSGNDLSMFDLNYPGGPQKLADDASKILERFVDSFITCEKPIVAAVQAPAIGIAVTILGLCDFVFAHERSTFQTPFTALGQSPEACSSVTFPALMGQTHANAMLLLGQEISASTAERRGLVTEVFGSDFDEQVAKRVKTLSNAYPNSMKESKKLIRRGNLKMLQEVNK